MPIDIHAHDCQYSSCEVQPHNNGGNTTINSYTVETRIPETRKHDGFTFQRTILCSDGGMSLDSARAKAWENAAYYALDPQTGYSPVGTIISSVCGTCQGRGKNHRERRRSFCNRGMHSDAGCWLPCESCQGEPYKIVESTEA